MPVPHPSTRSPAVASAHGIAPAKRLLASYTPIALAAALLPPVFPPSLPGLRAPVWLAIPAVTAGLWLTLTAGWPAPRRLLLGAGWLLVVLTTLQAFVVGDLIGMLALWLAVPILALLAGQLRHRGRRALLATHAIAAACWVGISVVMVGLSAVALTTRDRGTVLVTYRLMENFDVTLLPWANFAATLSGIALGLTTKWGLLRYYWVAIKLAISILVLVMAFGFLHNSLVAARADAERLTAVGDLGSLPAVVLGGFVFASINLFAAMLLSLYKPWGKTRRGRSAPPPTRRTAQQPPSVAQAQG